MRIGFEPNSIERLDSALVPTARNDELRLLYLGDYAFQELVGKPIRHMDFNALILINKEVVSLTGEKHEYTEEDERRIRSLLKDVEQREVEADFEEEILAKTSLLVFRIASGQYFHEGNKRTALVAGLAFLQMNGYTLDIKNTDLVAVVDRAGISAATLNDVHAALRRLIRSV